MKRFRQMLALLLALVMIASTLAACGEKDTATPDEAEAEQAIIATAVQFSKSGAYTTTVSSETVDLSAVTADKIEVQYYNLNQQNTLEIATVDEATPEATREEPSKAEITGTKKNDDGSWTIAFTDPDAAENRTAFYEVVFDGIEDSATVKVEFPEITLTQDLEFVTPADHTIKVALTIEGGEFTDGVAADDIELGVAFANMEVEVISASAQNLTVELKGDLTRSAANTYQCGTVGVRPSAVKDGSSTVSVEVPVKLESASFDAPTLKYEDGKITGDFKIYGLVDIDTLTKDNVKLDGATVEAVEKVDDNTVKLTVSAEDVNSVNRFADSFCNAELTLGDYVTTMDLCRASFYPVFDYVEQDGDSLKLTVKLYASNGTFAEGFSEDMITYDSGFADAKTESLTIDSDRLANLILTITANGMTEETLDVDGDITLAEGALLNLWGDTAYEAGYLRGYNAESMGKGIFGDLWDKIKDGASYVWDKVKDGASYVWDKVKDGASKAYDYYKEGVKQVKKGLGYISDFLGFDITGPFGGDNNAEVLSNQEKLLKCGKQILSELGAVRGDLAVVKSDLSEMKTLMHSVLGNQYEVMEQLFDMRNDPYRENLENLESYINRISMTYELGAIYMALEDAVADGRLAEMPSFKNVPVEKLPEALKPYSKYLPDISTMSDKQLADYTNRVIDYITARSMNKSDTEFKSFDDNYRELKKALTTVANKLRRTDSSNPLIVFDDLCAKKYNFDSQCFDFRASTRITALFLLAEGMELVTAFEKVPGGALSPDYQDIAPKVDEAILQINLMPIGHPASEIKAYPHTESVPVSQTGKYISDIALAGGNTQSEALNALIDAGYTPVNINLQRDNWVYLGYKATDNRNEAIKYLEYFTKYQVSIDPDLIGKETITFGGDATFTRAKCLGSEEFKATNGDFYYGMGYFPTYLYFSTTIDDGYQLYNICHTRFPGELGYSWESQSSRSVDRDFDEEYYPYSYVLKKKIAVKESAEYGSCTYSRWGAAILNGKDNYNGMNWTEAELDAFFYRAGGKTLQQELASAGINIKNPLLINYSVGQSCGKWLYNMRLLSTSATNYSSAYNKTEQEKKDLYAPTDTAFCLFEYFDAY